jgi:hypothetical protein
MKLFLVSALLAIAALPAAAQTRLANMWLSPAGEKAYRTLSAATQFTVGPAGFGGFSNEENALHTLLREQNAEQACVSLVNSANHEGGLYGLLGLRLLNEDAFKRQIEKYRMRQPPAERMVSGMKVSEGKIISMRGCFIFRVDWSETLTQLEAGAFDKEFQLDGKPRTL